MPITETGKKLASLKRNWDSHGSNPVANGAIERAEAILELFSNAQIKPMPSGGVIVFCEIEDRQLAIEINDIGNIVTFHVYLGEGQYWQLDRL